MGTTRRLPPWASSTSRATCVEVIDLPETTTSIARHPSIAESLPGYDVSSWYGICGPVGLDKAIQKKIETDVLNLLTQPKLKQRLTDMGVIVEPLDSAAFTEFFRAETARWAKVAREAGIEPQ